MKKHIVERAIVPHNPSASSIINKEKYNLYAPMVRRGQPGIAAFNPEQFIISDNVVSLNGDLIDMVNGAGEGAVQQIPDGVAGGFDFTGKNENSGILGTVPYGAQGAFASSFGGKSAALGKRSHAEGTTTIAQGDYSHAEGCNSVAIGDDSHAEGYKTTSVSEGSHAEGNNTVAAGQYSHVEGMHNRTEHDAAHAEGDTNRAKGVASHAEGKGNIASGDYSHAEGSYNEVKAVSAHAEGLENTIDEGAEGAHTSGRGNHAKHAGAQLLGRGLVSGRQNQTVVGQYNEYDDDAMFIVAAGKKYEPRNILVVRPDGTVEFEGKYYDYVVTDSLQFRNIGSLKGRILVKNVTFTVGDNGSVYKVSNDTSLLEFVNTSAEQNIRFTIEGNSNCKISGLKLPYLDSEVYIKNFGNVEDCILHGYYSGSFVNCTHVENCSAAYITSCKYVINCELSSEGDAVVQSCDYVSGICISDDFRGYYANTNVVCEDCNFVSNVDADGTYINCKYVDPDTCRGFVKSEDVGKVQVLTNDGTFATMTPVSNDTFNATIGDISTALDTLHAYAVSLINGGAV